MLTLEDIDEIQRQQRQVRLSADAISLVYLVDVVNHAASKDYVTFVIDLRRSLEAVNEARTLSDVLNICSFTHRVSEYL